MQTAFIRKKSPKYRSVHSNSKLLFLKQLLYEPISLRILKIKKEICSFFNPRKAPDFFLLSPHEHLDIRNMASAETMEKLFDQFLWITLSVYFLVI